MHKIFSKKVIIINLIALVLAIISVGHAIYAKNQQKQAASIETTILNIC